ncbi:hypothetical protein CsatB_020057 [Cannabis sativa]|uniref:nodulin-related protein 2 n=1 Tax=Cannabis sativa TaxID=3483 RepID=UPI0029CA8BDC|nr:nodulin-related protein 2 [Cannabis sativa]
MDHLLSNISGGPGKDHSTGDQHQAQQQHQNQQHPSSKELLSSAKLMAEAAQTAASHGFGQVDKGKTAGAAADLLDAGSKYGKLEEKSFGKHVEKAEDYLRQYETKNSTGQGHPLQSAEHHQQQAGHGGGDHHEKKQSDQEGGIGGYMKMAQGFMK